jgi:hypothetical protein
MPLLLRRSLLLVLLAGATAQAQDAPAINPAELFATLRQLREAQVAQLKTTKEKAIQMAAAGAASPDRAAAQWIDAVRLTQFEGVAQESAAFREWRDREGEGLKSKEAQAAARLFFVWLGLTLQRSNGAEVKTLLPSIINYTKEVTVVTQAADALEAAIKKERDAPGSKRTARQNTADDQAVRRALNQILDRQLAASPVVQWMKVGDYVKIEKWESKPGDVDGIFQKIILPELRAQKDPRVLEYWDMKMKREAEAASERQAEFEMAKFNTVRRPELQWSRALEYAEIGQKNRAAAELLGVIKANPAHPSVGAWIAELEKMFSPAPATPAPAATPTP